MTTLIPDVAIFPEGIFFLSVALPPLYEASPLKLDLQLPLTGLLGSQVDSLEFTPKRFWVDPKNILI